MTWPRIARSGLQPPCLCLAVHCHPTGDPCEKPGYIEDRYVLGAYPCSSPSIPGWALWDLWDPSLEAYRRIVTRLGSRGQISRHLAEVTYICIPQYFHLSSLDIRPNLQWATEGSKDGHFQEPPMCRVWGPGLLRVRVAQGNILGCIYAPFRTSRPWF